MHNVTEQARTRLAQSRQRQGDRRQVMLRRTISEVTETTSNPDVPQA
jgi:hypothetical protein